MSMPLDDYFALRLSRRAERRRPLRRVARLEGHDDDDYVLRQILHQTLFADFSRRVITTEAAHANLVTCNEPSADVECCICGYHGFDEGAEEDESGPAKPKDDRGTWQRLVVCSHVFHRECVVQSLTRSGPTCPLCRAKVDAPPTQSLYSHVTGTVHQMDAGVFM